MWDDPPNIIIIKLAPSLIKFLLSGAEALEASITAISKYGGASAGYRTLLDALIPASAMLQEVINNDHNLSVFIANVVLCDWHIYLHLQRLNAGDGPCVAFVLSSEAALAGAESTKHMQAQVTFILFLFPYWRGFASFRRHCNYLMDMNVNSPWPNKVMILIKLEVISM